MHMYGTYEYGTEMHHCLHGTANRRLAEEDGLKVYLCNTCHRLLHDKGLYDKDLQKMAQEKWMAYYGKTEDEFRKRYGKSYM